MTELEKLALEALIPPGGVLGGEPPVSAAISAPTGGRPARCG